MNVQRHALKALPLLAIVSLRSASNIQAQSENAIAAWDHSLFDEQSRSRLFVVVADEEAGWTQALEIYVDTDMKINLFHFCASNNFMNQQIQFSGPLMFESWNEQLNEFHFKPLDFPPLKELIVFNNGENARWVLDQSDWTASLTQPWDDFGPFTLECKEEYDWPYCGSPLIGLPIEY